MPRSSFALLLSAALALGGLSATAPAQAAPRVDVGIGITVAPPAPRHERRPPPRHGYVWAPGYWAWNPRLHRYVWASGRWLRARPGYRYQPPRWNHGPHGQWHFRGGYWSH